MNQPISPARSHIPQRKTQRKTKKDVPTKFFTMGEIKALLNEAGSLRKRPELATALIEVSFNHGLRSSEAALLQWEDISFDDNTISITRLKGGAAETLHPMIEGDRQVLLDLKEMYERKGIVATREVFKTEKGRGYIKVKQQRWFTKDGEERWGETYSAPGLSDLLKRIIRRCDGFVRQDRASHGLRHSCATYLAKAGKTEHQIQQWLGHTSSRNAKRYMGRILPDVGDALRKPPTLNLDQSVYVPPGVA
ncbi:MAG: site-specific integrase [Cyanobacteria bacterium P01_D01_bin.105]